MDVKRDTGIDSGRRLLPWAFVAIASFVGIAAWSDRAAGEAARAQCDSHGLEWSQSRTLGGGMSHGRDVVVQCVDAAGDTHEFLRADIAKRSN